MLSGPSALKTRRRISRARTGATATHRSAPIVVPLAIAFHTSPDLKTWTFTSRIDGFFECPDLFELPVNEKPENKKWVLYAADGKYLTGDFDAIYCPVDTVCG